jgi:hypothetical protein
VLLQMALLGFQFHFCSVNLELGSTIRFMVTWPNFIMMILKMLVYL